MVERWHVLLNWFLFSDIRSCSGRFFIWKNGCWERFPVFFFPILAQGKACCRWTVRSSESAILRGQAFGIEIANMYVEQVSESQVGLNLVTSRCHGHWRLLIIKLDPQMFLAKLRRSLIPLAPLSLVGVLNETHKKKPLADLNCARVHHVHIFP